MARKPSVYRPGPGRVWGFRAVIALIIIGALYLAFELGRVQAGYNLVDRSAERRDFRSRIVELEDRIRGLEEQIAILETNREIDATAYRDVEASLLELQAKIQEQRDALAFYRGIVSPDEGGRDLRVQQLRLSAGREEGRYKLRLVLVQAMRHDRRVSGEVALTVTGVEDGEEKRYALNELVADDEDASWEFAFRYFQDFEREIVLPGDFTPVSLSVEIRARTRSVEDVTETFDWVVAGSSLTPAAGETT